MKQFLAPSKYKLQTMGVLVLIIFAYICANNVTKSFLENRAYKQAQVELTTEHKKQIEELSTKIKDTTYEGDRFSSFGRQKVFGGALLSLGYILLLSYLGACFIDSKYNHKQ